MTQIDESKLILNLLSSIKFGYTNTLGSEKVDEIINNLMVILNDSIQELERLRANEKVLVDALGQCNEFAECANRSSHNQMKDALESVILTTQQTLAQVKKNEEK